MKSDLRLKTLISITGKYTGKSKFEFWNLLSEGDTVEISLKLESPGRTSRGLYATTIKFKNLRNGAITSASLTESTKYLSKVRYTEI